MYHRLRPSPSTSGRLERLEDQKNVRKYVTETVSGLAVDLNLSFGFRLWNRA